ncbi:MAG: hypothetical protein ABI884_03680 [Gemmatimonadota bacterium]
MTAVAPPLLKQNRRQFTIDRKAYDPLFRPFHRLNARTYDAQVDIGPTPSKIGPSGEGRDCGCRNRSDFKSSILTSAIVGTFIDALDSAINRAVPGSRDLRVFLEKQIGGKDTDLKKSLTDFLSKLFESGLFGGFLKNIPSWVPVNRTGFGPDFNADGAHNVGNDGKEAEVEVEGVLNRSYQTHHHRPYTQWSRYYHWAFHLTPAVGFKHLVRVGQLESPADLKREVPDASVAEPSFDRAINIYDSASKFDKLTTVADLECLLDIGAFSQPPGDQHAELAHPGIFYEKTWPFWPMHGDYFWATGRYVYDCTHVTPSKKTDLDKPNAKPEDIELHPALINPVKAFATARYEAASFDESDEPLPTVRFSFFSCRKGGYWDFDGDHLPFGNVDYVFAVDLPAAPSGDVAFDIGAIDDFALNTLVVRPRLLQKLEFAPYGSADDTIRWHTEPPKVEIVRPSDGSLPRMAKVTIPMSTVPKNKDGYGFTLSFAWLAPGVPTGVKKVTVKLDKMVFNRERADLRMTMAINGRTIFLSTANLSGRTLINPGDPLQNFPGSAGITLFLPPEKAVRISAHGAHRRGFGEFMEEKVSIDPAQPGDDPKSRTKDRRLAVGGVFNVSPEVQALLEKAAETKLGESIPKQLQGPFKDVIKIMDKEEVRKLLKAAVSDLVGQRRIVVWEKDVDFQESDAAKKDEIACAVAREMSVFPVDATNINNTPMGFVEFIDRSANTLPGDQSRLNVQNMLVRLKDTGSAVTTVEFFARPAFQVEEEEFVVSQRNPGEVDYALTVSVTIADPDPPR